MTTEDKFVRVIARLNALTQDGKLKWSSSLAIAPSEFRTAGPIFETTYKTKHLLVFEHLVKKKAVSLELAFSNEKNPVSIRKLALIFVDNFGKTEWEFPSVPGIRDLYKSIQYQDAGVDKFINEILEDELLGIDENEDS